MKSKSAEKIRLTSYDELFGAEDNNVEGTYTTVPLSQLRPFKNHPFKVLDDEKMQETVESVIQHGVIQPGIVRPCADGYEVVAGHRRWRACELAGKAEMPVIIRELDDDAATVLMVDTNIQRENLLPSEKARAYKMKYEALKHQGSKGDKYTADAVGEKAGDSGRTVQRYIRLASLIDGLLELVDTGKIAMIAGERLSFLKSEEQEMVLGAAGNIGVYPSPAQVGQLKAMSEKEELSEVKQEKPALENWQKAYENGEYLRSAEITEEQNYNMIDGRMNNLPLKPRKIGERISVLDRHHLKQAEIARKSGKPVPQMTAEEEMERRRK